MGLYLNTGEPLEMDYCFAKKCGVQQVCQATKIRFRPTLPTQAVFEQGRRANGKLEVCPGFGLQSSSDDSLPPKSQGTLYFQPFFQDDLEPHMTCLGESWGPTSTLGDWVMRDNASATSFRTHESTELGGASWIGTVWVDELIWNTCGNLN